MMVSIVFIATVAISLATTVHEALTTAGLTYFIIDTVIIINIIVTNISVALIVADFPLLMLFFEVTVQNQR